VVTVGGDDLKITIDAIHSTTAITTSASKGDGNKNREDACAKCAAQENTTSTTVAIKGNESKATACEHDDEKSKFVALTCGLLSFKWLRSLGKKV
jgi:hypothetical protein